MNELTKKLLDNKATWMGITQLDTLITDFMKERADWLKEEMVGTNEQIDYLIDKAFMLEKDK